MAEKIACLFPGIGYTCDKPLLYYSWKLLKGMGWEVVPVPYEIFVINVGRYIGESTRSEIAYALAQGKKVSYLE